jgi:hypothetical protein
LKDRYDVVRKDDLTDLYTNLNETVNAGPGSDDPKLRFKKIEQVNKKVKKAGGQLREDVELIGLTTVPLKASDLYRVKVDAIKASLKGKPTYDELQEYYRDYWFSVVREKEGVLNEAHFLKKYGFRYHKSACHKCGAMGHKKADCPERKDDGNHKPPLYKKKFEGNNFKKKYEGDNKKPYKKKNIDDLQCYNCQGKGHYTRDCPQKKSLKICPSDASRPLRRWKYTRTSAKDTSTSTAPEMSANVVTLIHRRHRFSSCRYFFCIHCLQLPA